MTYEQAIKATVTAKQAQKQVESHGYNWADFTKDNGTKETYNGKIVLGWMGY